MKHRALTVALALLAPLVAAGTAAAQPVAAAAHTPIVVHGHGSHGVVHQGCGKVWVPGRWEVRTEHHRVPERTRRVWCEPVYRYECTPCGVVKVLEHPGHWKVVVVEPARVECRQVRVWVPGHWR